MKARTFLVNSWFEVLLANDLKSLGRLDAGQDHIPIYSIDNGCFATSALIGVQTVRIGLAPKSFPIERFKPLFYIFLIFEMLHGSIVPNFRFRLQEIQEKESTG